MPRAARMIIREEPSVYHVTYPGHASMDFPLGMWKRMHC